MPANIHIYETVDIKETGSGVFPTAHGGTGGSMITSLAGQQPTAKKHV